MKVFDFNTHLPYPIGEIDKMTIYDLNMSAEELYSCYTMHREDNNNWPESANYMLFNQHLFSGTNVDRFIRKVKGDGRDNYLTALIDFRNKAIYDYMDEAIIRGIDCIKFHSYVQRIVKSDYPDVLKVCEYAEEKNLIICVDTSYGTSKMFVYDNLELVAFISESITKVPIVLLHSGGVRVLKALLLAEDKKNIFLETSLSIPYFAGSSVEQDFAFVYKKIGCERVLYGSDFPYVPLDESLNCTGKFLDKYKFKPEQIEKIMFKNAINMKNYG